MRFVHETLGQRVRFASGGAAEQLSEEVEGMGSRRVMVVAAAAERSLAEQVTAGLPLAVWHDEVAMHVPVDVAERARSVAEVNGVDLLVSVGGGSTTGLAKAVALTSGLPIVAVPTTYAGSEATDVWGLTEGSRKTTGVDGRVLPRTVVYDATLTIGLPVDLSVASGLNALAHCVDALWAPRADPLNAALAYEAIRALRAGLPVVKVTPDDLGGREQTLYGAYLAAVSFASAGSGLHHKICHVLGGMFNLPHAQTHAVVLPYVLALNGPAVPEIERRLAEALDGASATEGLRALREALGAPGALRRLGAPGAGMPEAGIEEAVAEVLGAAPAENPVVLTTDNVTALLSAAWRGEQP